MGNGSGDPDAEADQNKCMLVKKLGMTLSELSIPLINKSYATGAHVEITTRPS